MSQRIGITVGEPTGIGPEVIVRTLSKERSKNSQYVLYGSPRLLERAAKQAKIKPFWATQTPTSSTQNKITLVPSGPDPVEGYFSSEDKKQRAEAVLAALENATEDCRSEKITALITAPIDKSILRVLRPDFTGHTEYLAERAGHVRTVMMLDNTELRVALVTNHVALRDVSRSITQEILEETIRVSASGLRSYFGIERPRIAVAGLNPHAGEITKDAEEERIFQPVIKKLAADGWSVQGPFPGDSLFPKARNGKWDLLIAPYHDQGLIAAKYPGLDKVVNITLGLPYLRISPGHGVAYDIAGLNQADTRSFERALLIAEERKL